MARLGLGTKNNLLVLEKAALVAKIKAGDVRKIAFFLTRHMARNRPDACKKYQIFGLKCFWH